MQLIYNVVLASWASPVAQLVKNLPAMWETWVRSLGWEDPLEKGTATPLLYSGLENAMDCIFHGVTKSRLYIYVSFFFLLSHFSRVRLCMTPQTAAHQASLSLGFSRQEHWSRLPLPSPYMYLYTCISILFQTLVFIQNITSTIYLNILKI